MSHEGNDKIIDTIMCDMEVIENHGVKGIVCPNCSHTDTYTYDSPHHGLLLMCNVCEDGYEISFEEVKDE